MGQDVLVFEVGESGFDRYVIENSHKLPVVVEFMAVWSEPCVVMADTLHDLAEEFAGMFVFAKVDVDEQQGLKDKYEIQNVPTLKVFQNGEVAFTQEGQFKEDELRVLLHGMGVYRKSDELRTQAREKHMAGDTPGAIMLLTEAIKQDPANTRVAMDMVQIFIDMGELEQAKGLFNRLPDNDKESTMGKSLIGQLTFADLAAQTSGIASLTARLTDNADDHDARFDLAVCLVNEHNYDGAIDHLFTLQEKDPDYKDGAAREMIITISNMLASSNPELAQTYRRRLANLMNE
jgi:putative thioredoxin